MDWAHSSTLIAIGIMVLIGVPIGIAAVWINRKLSHQARVEADQARRSEQRFRLLVDGVRDTAIYMVDPEGFITSWNVGAQRIFGYTTAEIVGRNLSKFHTPEDIRGDLTTQMLTTALETGRFEGEGARLRKNGRRFWASVSLYKVRVAERTRELMVAKDAAEQANAAKSQFLANMSHELRTPLNAIIGYSEMLLEDLEGTPESGDLERITTAGHHLLKLINEVLDLSKIEAGQMELFVESFDLAELISEVVDGVGPLAINNGNSLECVQVHGERLGRLVGLREPYRRCGNGGLRGCRYRYRDDRRPTTPSL
jgi:PAS domain S-box-containing protein